MCDGEQARQSAGKKILPKEEFIEKISCRELLRRAKVLGIQGRHLEMKAWRGKGFQARKTTTEAHGHRVIYGHQGIVGGKTLHHGEELGAYNMVSVEYDESPVQFINIDGSETTIRQCVIWNIEEYETMMPFCE